MIMIDQKHAVAARQKQATERAENRSFYWKLAIIAVIVMCHNSIADWIAGAPL